MNKETALVIHSGFRMRHSVIQPMKELLVAVAPRSYRGRK